MAKVIPISGGKAKRCDEHRKPSGSRSRVVKASSGFYVADDGTQIYYEDSGGAGTPLFYVYGLGCTIQHFKYAREWFGSATDRSYRQIWIDYRGQGKSERSPRGLRLSLRRIADDIGGLCQHVDARNVVLWGQSLGGLIAMQVAERYPEQVSALILQGTPVGDPAERFPLPGLSQPFWKATIELNQLSNAPLRWAHAAFQRARRHPRWQSLRPLQVVWRELIRHNGFTPGLARTRDIDEYIQAIGDVPFDLFLDLAFDLTQISVQKITAQVHVPALIIAGRHDLLVPVADAELLASQLRQSELWIVEHGSHCPHFDDPTLVHTHVSDFIASISSLT